MRRELFKYISIPLILLILYLIFVTLYNFFDLPSEKEFIASAEQYYQQYGYWTVFVGALIEGLLFINWFLPGSIVVVLGVVFAKSAGLSAVGMVSLIILGFFITSLINYALGRYGWYKLMLKLGLEKPLNNIKAKTESSGLKIIFSTYLHPNLGALTATSAGILKFSFKWFVLYSLIALVVWNTLWGVLVYFLGSSILNYLGPPAIILVLVVWIGILWVRYKKKQENLVNIP
ncbi:MAG: VTT domain-containing protein [bacterium]|nr:VTT domain-containing protein [bacterium]